MYAYIDESGDTGLSEKASKNFVMTAVIVSDYRKLDRLAKKIFTRKVKYKDKVNQLHANKDTESVHKAILKYLKNIDYNVIYVNDKDYYKSLDHVSKSLKNYGVNKVYLSKRDTDKNSLRKINAISDNNFIEIEQTSPTRVKGLQIADFISWAIFRFIELDDDSYFSRLENVIEIKTKP